jgi:CheY-like chemotaxis protein
VSTTPKTKILIVDDEQINLEFFNVMLSRLGFQVSLAPTGEDALDAIRDNPPDLIILDVVMPGISGWDVIKVLKEDDEYSEFRDIPIIMFSAMDDADEKIKGFELGIEDYITKPFNFSEAFARIRAVLKHRELVNQTLRQEKRLERIDALRESLIYFTEHLKNPVEDLLGAADDLDADSKESIEKFRDSVKKECEQALAAIAGLADKIQEIETSESYGIKDTKTFLKELDQQYQMHYNNLHENP